MKPLLRSFFVLLAFASTSLFAQTAEVTPSAPIPAHRHAHKTGKLAKKSPKKHKKHKKKQAK